MATLPPLALNGYCKGIKGNQIHRIRQEWVGTTAHSQQWSIRGGPVGPRAPPGRRTLPSRLALFSSTLSPTDRCMTTRRVLATSAHHSLQASLDYGGHRPLATGMCRTQRSPTRTWRSRSTRPTVPSRHRSMVCLARTQGLVSTARTCHLSALIDVDPFAVGRRGPHIFH
jgi:hypothetical protein